MKWVGVVVEEPWLGVRVGEGAGSRRGARPVRGVLQVEEDGAGRGEVVVVDSFVGDVSGVCGLVEELKGFVGEVVGVVGRRVLIVLVDGDAGDSGRRKGEARGEPKERGEGL